ncbi:putative non-specific serine/threonine protein kinase [Helianthus annuus]|uniref:Non-specific serine/threonine protein kinase n=1 Tax=Helianthus annuus TaxID=4232 RepID=A0A9K3P114_HELAN|nr:putative non-specific serine/threonine protein kinase [Helianthus annuus]
MLNGSVTKLRYFDLSINSFSGVIPMFIGSMTWLKYLDLSTNFFNGSIPVFIGSMTRLSMSHMTSLDYMDASYNNLSGRIPSGTQLQTFEPTRYTGNTGLCGPPLAKYCPRDKELEVAPFVYGSEGEGEDDIRIWFYFGGGTGFEIGFWIACGALLVNRRGRKAFSRFLDISKDWVCVKLLILIAK